jgi:hypothetical protein
MSAMTDARPSIAPKIGVFLAPAQRRASTDLAQLVRVSRCVSGQTIVSMRQLTISRICALWLVALILVPFTAPFKTYDLGHSSSDGSLDWLPKDKSDSGEKLAPPDPWLVIPAPLTIGRLTNVAGVTRIDERRPLDTLLRL